MNAVRSMRAPTAPRTWKWMNEAPLSIFGRGRVPGGCVGRRRRVLDPRRLLQALSRHRVRDDAGMLATRGAAHTGRGRRDGGLPAGVTVRQLWRRADLRQALPLS